MNDSDYDLWASAHILATGANEGQMREFLEANRDAFRRLGATYAELCECTQRLIEQGRIPNWPHEHANSVIGELKALRSEHQKSFKSGTYGAGYSLHHEKGCDCPNCNNGEILPSYEQRIASRDRALVKLKDYIRRNGGTVIGDEKKKKKGRSA